jgi:SET domain-containing protein
MAEPAQFETEWLIFKASPIHGTGAFSKKRIPAKTRLLEYRGEKITKTESLKRCEADNQYIFALNAEWDLDGNVDWNPARWLNHSCAPNCEAELNGDRIWIFSLREIEPGEEITFNYGYDLSEYQDYPCKCGAPGCVRYIVAEEFFGHVKAQAAIRQEGKSAGRG